MTKIAMRRTCRSNAPMSLRGAIVPPRRLSTQGTTMSFDTMIESATDSTITIAVAAESPPMNATRVRSSEPAESGNASTNMSLSA
jgi:hypothetical protein